MATTASRNPRGPNAPVDPSHTHEAKSEILSPADAVEAATDREENEFTAEALDETMTLSEADARREVPRLRDDNINSRKDKKLKGPAATRNMLSSRQKKEYSRTKNAWVKKIPNNRRIAVNQITNSPENLEQLNRALRDVHGTRSELPDGIHRHASNLDRAIQAYERTNDRQHIVYSTLRAPKEHGNSRVALRKWLESNSGDERGDLTFDGYIPSTHSMGNINQEKDIVMEIRTRSGAYLGESDSTPNADHLMGRGRTLRPMAVNDVEYIDANGNTKTRTIVQMEDVTNDGRTTAR